MPAAGLKLRALLRTHRGNKPMTRDNVLYLVIGALVVAVGVLGFQLYEAKKEPKGVQLNIGERGISIETK
jgi:hypothetical protein